MKNISNYFLKISTIKTLLISSIIFVLFMIIVLPKVSSYTEEVTGSSESPDISLFYSSDDLFDMAEDYGEEGRDAYILLRYTFDIVWPVVYLMFMATSIGVLFKKLKLSDKYKFLILLPLLGVIFDFLENITSVIVMYRYPVRATFFANVAPYMTLIKWSILGVSFLSIVVLLIILVIDKVKSTK